MVANREPRMAAVETKSDRDKLIEGNMRLARQIAESEFPGSRDYDDLEGAGYLALVQAAERFDPAKGGSFNEFAAKSIRRAVQQEGVRLGRHSRNRGHEEFRDEEMPVSFEGGNLTSGIWQQGTQERLPPRRGEE